MECLLMKFYFLLSIFIISFLFSCENHKHEEGTFNDYSYKKTKILIKIIDKAAEILEQDGIDALKKYDESITFEEIYFYVYRLDDALCIYHGEDSTKQNKAILNQKDYLGKNIHNLIVSAINNETNKDSWVHFNWSRPHNIFPIWKSSAHRKVKLSNGDYVYLGAGIYGYIAEREFIRISVENADALIKDKGIDALQILQSPTSEFTFYDSFIFIYDFDGNSIIDPTYKDGSNNNLLDFIDASNQKPFLLIKNNLTDGNISSWGQIQYKDNTSMNLKKKIIYAKKSILNDTEIIIGAMINSPKSIWFK
jgi:signal transduction histidine kinase